MAELGLAQPHLVFLFADFSLSLFGLTKLFCGRIEVRICFGGFTYIDCDFLFVMSFFLCLFFVTFSHFWLFLGWGWDPRSFWGLLM